MKKFSLIIKILFGLATLVVALLAWLKPFTPSGPSPLSKLQSTPTNFLSTTQSQIKIQSQIIDDKRTALENYGAIYEQVGWCGLWNYLLQEGGVSGDCPQPRYGQSSTSSNIEIVDGFISKEGDYISAFAIQADTDIQVNYSYLHCVSFDPNNLSIQYKLSNNRVTKNSPSDWIASDILISGPISLWLRCDGNWQ